MDICIKHIEGKGRGVISCKDFGPSEIVESSPVIVLPDTDLEYLSKSGLYEYYFDWAEKGWAIGLGLTSIYNHSTSPNVRFNRRIEDNIIEIITCKVIKQGEEMVADYGCFIEFKEI